MIPHSFIDSLLERIDIVDVVDSVVPLKKKGKDYSACCPFHQEKSPSFYVSADKQLYYCFGCGAGGNVVSFIKEYHHLDFVEAIEFLAQRLHIDVPRETSAREQAQHARYQALNDLLAQISQYYQKQLGAHTQALNYLQQRGLEASTCQRFGIGYAPPGWDNLLQALEHNDSPALAQQLTTAGMRLHNPEQNREYDRFRNRIMFPIRDRRGRVLGFGGRVLDDSKPKYLNSPETPLFHKGRELYGLYEALQSNRQLDRLLVVEGYMDVVALAQQGVNYAVATLGTACTPEHVQLLFKQVSQVTFCFDGDAAGRKAAWRALEATLPQMEGGRSASFLFLPDGEDPDSLIRQEGRTAFETRLKEDAQELAAFFFGHLAEGLALDTINGRNQLSERAGQYLAPLPAGNFRKMLEAQLAEQIGIRIEDLQLPEPRPERQHSLDARPQTPSPRPEPTGTPTPQATSEHPPKRERSSNRTQNVEQLAQRAIRLLLQAPALASRCAPLDSVEHEQDPDLLLLHSLLQTFRAQPTASACLPLGQWYGTAAGARLQAIGELELPIAEIEPEFLDTLGALRKLAAERRLEQHRQQIGAIDYRNLDKTQARALLDTLYELKLKKHH